MRLDRSRKSLAPGHPVYPDSVEIGEPRPGAGEVRETRWMEKGQLRRLLEERPGEIFTFQLGALDYYLNYDASW